MPEYNLPPGVSLRDIPGNRPEDEAWERFHEEVDRDCTHRGLDDMEATVAWHLGVAAYLRCREFGAVFPADQRPEATP